MWQSLFQAPRTVELDSLSGADILVGKTDNKQEDEILRKLM